MARLLRELFSIERDFRSSGLRQKRGLELLLSKPGRAAVIVARNGCKKAGAMVSVQLVISTAEGAPSAWIEDMVVSKPYRSQGLGRALLEKALDWAKQKGAVRTQLLADLDNQPALGFYKHLGWRSTRLGAWRVFLRERE